MPPPLLDAGQHAAALPPHAALRRVAARGALLTAAEVAPLAAVETGAVAVAGDDGVRGVRGGASAAPRAGGCCDETELVGGAASVCTARNAAVKVEAEERAVAPLGDAWAGEGVAAVALAEWCHP